MYRYATIAFFVVLAISTAALLIFGVYKEKNRIVFVERGIDVQCSFSAPRFDRSSIYINFVDQKNLIVMETGCADDLFVYGYNEDTRELLYVAQMGATFISNITYYMKPTDDFIAVGVVQKCDGRTVRGASYAFSMTYQFPCTDEVGVVPVPKNGTVHLTSFFDDIHYRYYASCGAGCDRTVEMTENGSWLVVSP